MAERGVHSASWFAIGFLAGVAATLAAMIYAGGRSNRDTQAAAPPAVAVARAHPRRLVRLRHPIQPPPDSAAPAAAAPQTSAAPDEQVQEDAAATGMTSRAQSPAQNLN